MKIFILLILLTRLSVYAENLIKTQFTVNEVKITENGRKTKSLISSPKIISHEGKQAFIVIGDLSLTFTPVNTPKGLRIKGSYSMGKNKTPFEIILKKDEDTLVIHNNDKSFYELTIKSRPLPPEK